MNTRVYSLRSIAVGASSRRTPSSRIAAAALSIAIIGICICSASAQTAQNGWKRYAEPKYGFSLAYPDGWTIQVNERSVFVKSPDSASFAVINNFTPAGDETAEDHIDSLPRTAASVLPMGVVKEAYTLDAPVKAAVGSKDVGEQAFGDLTYTGAAGPGRARVICLVFPHGGLLFGLAAPTARFDQDRKVMLKILQSFKFNAPARPNAPPSSSAERPDKSAPVLPQTSADATSGLKFTRWTEAKERSFSVEVPEGWTTVGGLFRPGLLDYRQSVLTRSSHSEMLVMYGDAGVPQFQLPSQTLAFLGHHDGDTYDPSPYDRTPHSMATEMHLMRAEEFNKWYLQHHFGKVVNDIHVEEYTDNPDITNKLQQKLNDAIQPGSPSHAIGSIGATRFSCTTRDGGRKLVGILTSRVIAYVFTAQGEGHWSATPFIYAWAAGDGGARQSAAKAVFDHVMNTFSVDQEWAKADFARATQVNQAFISASKNVNAAAQRQWAAQNQARAEQIQKDTDDWRAKSMSDFNDRMAAKDAHREKAVDHILDRTTVTNGADAWKVASGYSYYYENTTTGTIVGTNDPTSPGYNYSQLLEKQ